jgi:hypothetical protein
MSGNSLNLFCIVLAILTYGSLTIFVVRSALRKVCIRPDLAAEERRCDTTALRNVGSLESVLGAVPRPELCANPTGVGPRRR